MDHSSTVRFDVRLRRWAWSGFLSGLTRWSSDRVGPYSAPSAPYFGIAINRLALTARTTPLTPLEVERRLSYFEAESERLRIADLRCLARFWRMAMIGLVVRGAVLLVMGGILLWMLIDDRYGATVMLGATAATFVIAAILKLRGGFGSTCPTIDEEDVVMPWESTIDRDGDR